MNPPYSHQLDYSHPFLDGTSKRLLIDGQWIPSSSGNVFVSTNPSTGDALAEVSQGNAVDIDLAVHAAHRAFKGPWSKFKPFDRQQLLLKLADLIEANYDDLARLESMDYGGVIARTLARRRRHIGMLRYYASLAVAIQGDTVENSVPGNFFSYTLKEPVGVVGAIYAWNAPLDMVIWKVAPALAAGCTVVVKPAMEAALTALRFGELLIEAGLPDGVVNVVPGDVDAGRALVKHPLVNKISFTGSTSAGQQIVQDSSGSMKRLSLELGGKSPNIVFDDAHLDDAIQGAAMGVFANSGQSCVAGSRVFVQRGIYDAFLERVVMAGKKLKVGNSLDPLMDLGPLISAPHMNKVIGHIERGVQAGAKLMSGGNRLDTPSLRKGHFVEPTIFSDVTDDMAIAQQEIFGPVMSILPFTDADEVIARSNQSEYGLAGGIWTRDLQTAHHVARSLSAGSVWVNCYTQLDPAMPFGGFKMSGYGRESGIRHLDSFLEVKSVTIKIN